LGLAVRDGFATGQRSSEFSEELTGISGRDFLLLRASLIASVTFGAWVPSGLASLCHGHRLGDLMAELDHGLGGQVS
jgi:hypothetical protein